MGAADPVMAAWPLDCGVEPALAHSLADELVKLTNSLAELAFDLASDPDILRRHMQSLQDVDRITQTQLAVVDILRGCVPADQRIGAVTLEKFEIRLATSFERYRRDGRLTPPVNEYPS